MFPAEEAGLFHEHRMTAERVISYLKPNKVSKNKETRKSEYADHF